MKPLPYIASLAGVLALCGCQSRDTAVRVTNQNSPGPVAGNVVGAGVGTVAGNVAGAGVGVVEGTVATTRNVFDPQPTRVVRHWKMETTADGRTIQVPVDYLVDEEGRVIKEIPPGQAFR
ncbi:MAG: flagellar motor protein MotB [Verrucomicrobia bacterium]|jgi:hypothetical protein|nr:flagellar motor protein MotB [Verrucomicrobiota bacterium]